MTKKETEQTAIGAPLTGFATQTGTITAADSVLVGIEKNAGNLATTNANVSAAQVGNSLFNYYNFK